MPQGRKPRKGDGQTLLFRLDLLDLLLLRRHGVDLGRNLLQILSLHVLSEKAHQGLDKDRVLLVVLVLGDLIPNCLGENIELLSVLGVHGCPR